MTRIVDRFRLTPFISDSVGSFSVIGIVRATKRERKRGRENVESFVQSNVQFSSTYPLFNRKGGTRCGRGRLEQKILIFPCFSTYICLLHRSLQTGQKVSGFPPDHRVVWDRERRRGERWRAQSASQIGSSEKRKTFVEGPSHRGESRTGDKT